LGHWMNYLIKVKEKNLKDYKDEVAELLSSLPGVSEVIVKPKHQTIQVSGDCISVAILLQRVEGIGLTPEQDLSSDVEIS